MIRPSLRRRTSTPDRFRDRCPVGGGGRDVASVGSWRGPYDAIEFERSRLGPRANKLRKVVGLPSRVDAEFCVALEIGPADAAERTSR